MTTPPPSNHPAVNPNCNHCGGSGLIVFAEGEFTKAAACDCISTCPLCNGSTFMRTQSPAGSILQRCQCQRLADLLKRYQHAQLPGRMANKQLANFNFAEVSTNVVRTVSPFLAHYKPGQMNPGLLFHGPVGRGKTHLLAAIVRNLITTHGVSARFVEFSHLLADLKNSFGRGGGAARLIDPLVEVDILAIDELGKGRNTEFEGTVLDELVSRRYNAGRTILATTNYAPGASEGLATPDFVSGNGPALIDRVGDRVYSRLLEMCTMVRIEGADYRQKIAKNGLGASSGVRR
jgi:DNA replication protein DnaC